MFKTKANTNRTPRTIAEETNDGKNFVGGAEPPAGTEAITQVASTPAAPTPPFKMFPPPPRSWK